LQLLAKSMHFTDPVTGRQRSFQTRLSLLAGLPPATGG